MQSIMQYIYDHPETVAIVWPIITGLLSLAYGALSRRFPVVTAILRASGLDLPALGAALRKRLETPAAPQVVAAAADGPFAPGRVAVLVHGPQAESLYEAYIASSGGLNYQGKPCPKWEELPEAIRGHWEAVADSVAEAAAGYLKARGADATPITTTREVGE